MHGIPRSRPPLTLAEQAERATKIQKYVRAKDAVLEKHAKQVKTTSTAQQTSDQAQAKAWSMQRALDTCTMLVCFVCFVLRDSRVCLLPARMCPPPRMHSPPR